MHAGFHALRSSLPMNLRAHVPGFTVWSAARADLERIFTLWRGCLERWGGPWLLGERFTAADILWGGALNWTTMFGIVPKRPEIMAYVERMQARPAVARVRELDTRLVAEHEAALAPAG